VEGVNNSHGTHGKIHKTLADMMADVKKGGLFGWGAKDKLSYDEAATLAAKSVQKTFPESRCSLDCLKAQLDGYYKNKCKGSLELKSGTASTVEEDPDASQ